jgi:hypothetical protein
MGESIFQYPFFMEYDIMKPDKRLKRITKLINVLQVIMLLVLMALLLKGVKLVYILTQGG